MKMRFIFLTISVTLLQLAMCNPVAGISAQASPDKPNDQTHARLLVSN